MIKREFSIPMDQILSRIREKIRSLGADIFAEIDHALNAEKVGLKLEPTRVLIFGNPRIGTLLMQENREIAYELPLRLAIWSSEGKTFVLYELPSEIGKRFGITNEEVLKKMDAFMDNVVNVQ
ncbi:hypothetical protein L3N51_02302 [Metallosphaera sp. J1]|uniref:DUF302 domain-containing protein n=1 Tax=Metallosphaera TaxID=41980 RepID=UPI001EE13AD1|nr:DUF302 domain-containing protein [Metallosphaera javensis (ex Hofmann et al. 2022)]MCG3110005.1 hypothetical protein [Metallosphaera javensis (ex Hofmann et al. 2022)]BCS93714.1 MAG: hypothetical protein MjAS7_2322 [Metallosphaera javensis (ex Sakai et al. 2022)]